MDGFPLISLTPKATNKLPNLCLAQIAPQAHPQKRFVSRAFDAEARKWQGEPAQPQTYH